MSNHQYNIPYPYDSSLRYDGYYLDVSIVAASSQATGFTYGPVVSILDQFLVGVSVASAFTWNPTVSAGGGDVFTGVKLYDGYPKPEDTNTTNSKVTVIGGKLAYKLTRNYWTTKL